MTPKKDLRRCSACGKIYQHTPIIFDGKDLNESCTMCDECYEKSISLENDKMRKQAAIRVWVKSIGDEYRDTDMRHKNFPMQIYKLGKDFLRNRDLPFFGMISGSGLGKSRVSAMLAKLLIWNGEHVTWVSSFALQEAAQDRFDSALGADAKSSIANWRKCRNLVLDDLGNVKPSEVVASLLYSILEERSNYRRLTIWSANETPEQMLLGSVTETARARVISRLVGYSRIVNF